MHIHKLFYIMYVIHLGPRWAQDGRSWRQVAPKMGHDSAKLGQDGAKMGNFRSTWEVSKPFFGDLVNFITSGPVVAMEVQGENVIAQIRNLMGATNPSDSTPGSIRGDLATELDKNVVHGSDSEESANRELSIFFGN